MTSPFGKARYALAFLFVILAVNFLVAQKVRQESAPEGNKLVPHGDGSVDAVPDTGAAPTGQAVVTGNGINYNGGPVLKGNPVPIYVIWYGNWNGTGSNTQATVSLVDTWLNSVGNTGYEKINTTYGDATGNVSGNLNLGGQIFDTGSQGTRLNNNRLSAIVSRSFTNGLPVDANGVYVVITASNISEQGFCSQFCGFHTRQTLSGADIKWAFVGNTDRCPSGCEIQATGPNSPASGVGGADGLINVLTHETEEAITDPDLNAWFDASGAEDADKCNFKFGPTTTCTTTNGCTAAGAAAGARFNQTFGAHNWMMQMEWENSRGGGCDQTLGGPFFTN
ncbi:MAG TPA: hypothetical protein VF532_07315 [Candidatus Angelobacter sp.]